VTGQLPGEEPGPTGDRDTFLPHTSDVTADGEVPGTGPRHGRSRPMRRRRDGTLVPRHHYGRWLGVAVVAGFGSYLGVIHSSSGAQPNTARTATVASPRAAQVTSPLSATVPAPSTSGSATSPGTASTPAASVGQIAPNGTFTSLTGGTTTISSLLGKPLMVWFVAGGCASCAVSIPMVAQHLAQLHADQVTVVTLGLPDWFDPGAKGLQELQFFGKTAAHVTIPTTTWIWGMPTSALVRAYDPTGTPDVYSLVGPGGHIRYQNSVPASTMPQLLAAAKHLDAVPASKT